MKINYKLNNSYNADIKNVKNGKPLPFGMLRTAHMFLMDFKKGKWHNPRIVPYKNLEIAPGALGLNYSQSIFEGMKAFKHADGKIYTFRIADHAKRFNHSADIMCMPHIPIDDQICAINSIIDIERNWFPEQSGASFYIRPLMYGSEDCLGVRPANSYTYCIFISPSGSYYPEGLKGITLLITKKFQRVLPWGIGTAKTGNNYGSTLFILEKAKKMEAQQVLYLDQNGKYIGEAGTMNHFYVTTSEEIIIPEFNNSILESITSLSFLAIAKQWGLKIRQKKVTLAEFLKGIKNESIVEAGGLGTAAVVTPVTSYVLDNGEKLTVGDGKVGPIIQKMYSLLMGIQNGKIPAPEGWLTRVPSTPPNTR